MATKKPNPNLEENLLPKMFLMLLSAMVASTGILAGTGSLLNHEGGSFGGVVFGVGLLAAVLGHHVGWRHVPEYQKVWGFIWGSFTAPFRWCASESAKRVGMGLLALLALTAMVGTPVGALYTVTFMVYALLQHWWVLAALPATLLGALGSLFVLSFTWFCSYDEDGFEKETPLNRPRFNAAVFWFLLFGFAALVLYCNV